MINQEITDTQTSGENEFHSTDTLHNKERVIPVHPMSYLTSTPRSITQILPNRPMPDLHVSDHPMPDLHVSDRPMADMEVLDHPMSDLNVSDQGVLDNPVSDQDVSDQEVSDQEFYDITCIKGEIASVDTDVIELFNTRLAKAIEYNDCAFLDIEKRALNAILAFYSKREDSLHIATKVVSCIIAIYYY